MIKKNGIRAFELPEYDYYELTECMGILPKGTVFVHDPDDNINGSESQGCLKLCWTENGDCFGGIVGNSVILHFSFTRSYIFKKIKSSEKSKLLEVIQSLKAQLKITEEKLKNI